MRGQVLFDMFVDGSFGTLLKAPNKYNGMIGELLDRKADLAIAPLTITENRMKVIDFTQPFMTSGAGIFLLRDKNKIQFFS